MRRTGIFISDKKRARRKLTRQLFLCLLPCLVGLGIVALSRIAPAHLVETIYSQHLFRWIAAAFGLLGRLTGSFSMAELILTLIIMALLSAVIALPFFLWKYSEQRSKIISRYLCGLVLIPSSIFMLFSVTCAPNYNRLTFAEQSGLSIRPSSVDELDDLCMTLLVKTNEARALLGDEALSDRPFPTTSREVQRAFNTLEADYPFLGQAPLPAKRVVFSKTLSALNLTGVYFPYTAEANVNVDMPDTELPFTIAHELAHTCGMMREDEANFIGYLACLRSEDPYVRYSGLYCALAHSMNALYSVDTDRYFEIRAQYSQALSRDSVNLSAYWQPYQQTPAAKLSDTVNDVYLKANNLSDGVQSYGRMVDLLLAEHREKNAQ